MASWGWAATYNVTWDGDGQTTIDGDTFCSGTCSGGDTITLPSGTTNDYVYFHDLRGSVDNPIVIRNSSGAQTIIDRNGGLFGVRFQDSKYVSFDGSYGYSESDPDNLDYGIRITDALNAGLVLNRYVEEIEISYIQIDDIGSGSGDTFAVGIQEITKATDAEMSAGQSLSGLHIHHNYIHDVWTEGMYLQQGNLCGVSGPTCCDGQDDADDAVEWSNVIIEYNKLDNIGWDGIQTSCDDETIVRNNYVTDYGIAEYSGSGQAYGITLHYDSGGSVYNNEIYRGAKSGIALHVGFAVSVYNNVIGDVGSMAAQSNDEGIYDSASTDSAYITIVNNTIVSPDGSGITLSASQTGRIQDNLFVDLGASNSYPSATSTYAGVTKSTVAEVNFTAEGSDDYSLTATTPSDILDSAQDNAYTPSTDIIGTSRPQNNDSDIGAYEIEATPDPPSGGITGVSLTGVALN